MRSIVLAAILMAGLAWALDDPRTPLEDPYQSGMWDYQQVNLLGNPDEIRFDDRVIVIKSK